MENSYTKNVLIELANKQQSEKNNRYYIFRYVFGEWGWTKNNTIFRTLSEIIWQTNRNAIPVNDFQVIAIMCSPKANNIPSLLIY